MLNIHTFLTMNHKQRKNALHKLKKYAKRATIKGDKHRVSYLVKLILRLRNVNVSSNGMRHNLSSSFRDFVNVRHPVARLSKDDYVIKKLTRSMSFTNALDYFDFYFCREPVLATGTSLTVSETDIPVHCRGR